MKLSLQPAIIFVLFIIAVMVVANAGEVKSPSDQSCSCSNVGSFPVSLQSLTIKTLSVSKINVAEVWKSLMVFNTNNMMLDFTLLNEEDYEPIIEFSGSLCSLNSIFCGRTFPSSIGLSIPLNQGYIFLMNDILLVKVLNLELNIRSQPISYKSCRLDFGPNGEDLIETGTYTYTALLYYSDEDKSSYTCNGRFQFPTAADTRDHDKTREEVRNFAIAASSIIGSLVIIGVYSCYTGKYGRKLTIEVPGMPDKLHDSNHPSLKLINNGE